ncbi:hypothetical protein YB2330_000157 [Saitoella coloradoensis]
MFARSAIRSIRTATRGISGSTQAQQATAPATPMMNNASASAFFPSLKGTIEDKSTLEKIVDIIPEKTESSGQNRMQ